MKNSLVRTSLNNNFGLSQQKGQKPPTPEQLLRGLFDKIATFEIDGRKYLSKQGFFDTIRMFESELNEQQFDKIMIYVDKDLNGNIDYSMFMDCQTSIQTPPPPILEVLQKSTKKSLFSGDFRYYNMDTIFVSDW